MENWIPSVRTRTITVQVLGRASIPSHASTARVTSGRRMHSPPPNTRIATLVEWVPESTERGCAMVWAGSRPASKNARKRDCSTQRAYLSSQPVQEAQGRCTGATLFQKFFQEPAMHSVGRPDGPHE